jgi:hypothetical protein
MQTLFSGPVGTSPHSADTINESLVSARDAMSDDAASVETEEAEVVR